MYLPHEKVANFKNAINSFDFSDDVKELVCKTFDRTFEYSPDTKSRVYTHEEYLKMKEKHGGKLWATPANKLAKQRYTEKHREEINRKARERYHATKNLAVAT